MWYFLDLLDDPTDDYEDEEDPPEYTLRVIEADWGPCLIYGEAGRVWLVPL